MYKTFIPLSSTALNCSLNLTCLLYLVSFFIINYVSEKTLYNAMFQSLKGHGEQVKLKNIDLVLKHTYSLPFVIDNE